MVSQTHQRHDKDACQIKKERKNTIKLQLHTNKNKLNVSDKTNINSKKNEICHMSVWLWMQVRKKKIISSMPE